MADSEKMWECPDFFTLDGKDVVLVSPQDMLPKGFEYHNGDGTLCLIGKFDEETKTFIPEKRPGSGLWYRLLCNADSGSTRRKKNYDRLDAELGYMCE